MKFVATCAFGLESLVNKELEKLGIENTTKTDGKVTFYGEEKEMMLSNIWLRTAERVFMQLTEFEATNFDEFFEGVKKIDWENHLEKNADFPVLASSAKSILFSEKALQSVGRKAIIEKLKQTYSIETFPCDGAKHQILFKIQKNICSVFINTSGQSLHKRSYRVEQGVSPIKETLAAAMIMLSDWQSHQKMIDPFCGGGTLCIESAMMAKNIAPGIKRDFDFLHWPNSNKNLFEKLIQEANDVIRTKMPIDITGFDDDPKMISASIENAKKASVPETRFYIKKLDELNTSDLKNSTIITNPPYGERLGTKEESMESIHTLGKLFRQSKNTSLFIISPQENFQRNFGLPSDKNRKLYNGKIKCHLYQFFKKNA